jgi:chaperonin GroEL
MSSKEIVFDVSARQALLAGVDALANAVKVTLGPRGRNVAFERSWASPKVTKDGVTVANEIELEPKLQNMGALMVREVASRTNDHAGDGTTTATVLAQAIYQEGVKLVEAGAKPIDLKRGIDRAAAAVIENLKSQAKSASTDDEVRHIATVSSNGDDKVGRFVADALKKVGRDGVVTVSEGQGLETEVEIVEGMRWDRGYISPYFITDQQGLEVELEQPYILVTEKKISSLADLVPVLEAIVKVSGTLLVVAEDVDGEALAALVVNKLRGVLKIAAVKAPGFGDRRKELIKDIAALCGATPFMNDIGRKLDSATIADLGRAEKVVIDKENTTLVAGKGDKATIAGRIDRIKKDIEETNSDYDKEKLRERLAKLAGGVALIKVGAHSEVEAKEQKFRVEDAVNATQAALAEGYVPGGGVALIRAASVLKDLKHPNDDQRHGAEILGRAIEAPLAQIARNAGAESGVVLGKVKEGKGSFGYDAYKGEYGDLVSAGIIDPVKVVRLALENAASIASVMLTTDCAIFEIPKPKAPAPGRGPTHPMRPSMDGMDMD